MNLLITSLVDNFCDAARGIRFTFKKIDFVFNRRSGLFLGILPKTVTPVKSVFDLLENHILPKGHMTQMNAASFLNSLVLKHNVSNLEIVSYLKSHVRLYNASLGQDNPVSEVAKIESIKKGQKDKKGRDRWALLEDAYNNPIVKNTKGISGEEEKLQSIKIRAWALDFEDGTGVDFERMEEVLLKYSPPAIVSKADKKSQPTTAIPKEVFLPDLVKLRNKMWLGKPLLSDTQAGIILCHLLHGRETRNDGVSYVTHPMAVANLIVTYGSKYLPHDGGDSFWIAACKALEHDCGEKSGIDINCDLEGLHDDSVTKGVRVLHKAEGDSYFLYLKKCADDSVTTLFVKLCDIFHNSSDAKDLTSKQAFVYLIAANYLKYRLVNRHDKLSVADYVRKIVQDEAKANSLYRIVNEIAESKDIKDETGETIKPALKKMKATEFPELKETMDDLIKSGKLKPVLELLSTADRSQNANPRREEKPSLQP